MEVHPLRLEFGIRGGSLVETPVQLTYVLRKGIPESALKSTGEWHGESYPMDISVVASSFWFADVDQEAVSGASANLNCCSLSLAAVRWFGAVLGSQFSCKLSQRHRTIFARASRQVDLAVVESEGFRIPG